MDCLFCKSGFFPNKIVIGVKDLETGKEKLLIMSKSEYDKFTKRIKEISLFSIDLNEL